MFISNDNFPKLKEPEGTLNSFGEFVIKDSGKRIDLPGGMVRDTAEGKIDYTLVLDGPMFKRWAEHLTKGAVKYEKRNWMKGEGEEVEQRFRESLVRHLFDYLEGKTDEDHAAAVIFNLNGLEYSRLKNKQVRVNLRETWAQGVDTVLNSRRFSGLPQQPR